MRRTRTAQDHSKWSPQCKNSRWLRVLFSLLALLALSLTSSTSYAQKEIRVGVFEVDPLTFIEEGKPSGLFVDLLEEVAKNKGWKLKYQAGTFDEQFAALNRGELDLMPTIAWSAERSTKLDYTEEPVMALWGEVFVHRGTKVPRLPELSGKRVGLMASDINGQNFRGYISKFDIACEFVEFGTFDEVFTAIRDKQVVAGVAPNIYGYRHGEKFDVVNTPIMFSPISVHYAAKKGRSRAILAALDAALIKWKTEENSYYRKRLAFWFGGEAPGMRGIPAWLLWGLSSILALAFILVVYNRLLETRVRSRTQDLAKSERRFRALFNNQFQFAGLLSTEGILLEANAASLAAIGAQEEEVKGMAFWDCPWWNHNPEMQSLLKKGIFDASEGHFVRFDATHADARGEIRWIDFSITPIFDAAGEVELLVPEGRDITARKVLEAELRQAQKMEAIGTLAGGIAHDFNNILTVIVGNAELVQSGLKRNDRCQKDLDNLLDGTDRARELVQQILSFSRKRAIQKGPVELERVLGETLGLLRASLPATISIEKQVETPGRVIGDALELQRLVMNLATNAFHAMPKGGKLSFRLTEKVVTSPEASDAEQEPKEFVLLEILDTGEGMSPETVEKIFEPYFSTKGATQGTGLGLAVVHGIVRDLGGWIDVETSLGAGTCFKIWIPSSEQTEEREITENPPLASEGNEHLLVVDDEEANVAVVTSGLTRLGYRVSGFSDPAAAIKAFKSAPEDFDGALLDLTMPNLSGIDAARQLREFAKEGTVIAIWSGLFDEASEEAALDIPVEFLLHKPASPKKIAQVFRKAWSKRQKSKAVTSEGSS